MLGEVIQSLLPLLIIKMDMFNARKKFKIFCGHIQYTTYIYRHEQPLDPLAVHGVTSHCQCLRLQIMIGTFHCP